MTHIRVKSNKFTPLKKLWNDKTALNVVANKQKLVLKGHGDGETR